MGKVRAFYYVELQKACSKTMLTLFSSKKYPAIVPSLSTQCKAATFSICDSLNFYVIVTFTLSRN